MSQAPIVTDAELFAALNTTDDTERSAWVDSLTEGEGPGLPLDQLLEVASEELPEGPLDTILGLLQGLIVKHQADDATLAALIAIEQLHLPMLVRKLQA